MYKQTGGGWRAEMIHTKDMKDVIQWGARYMKKVKTDVEKVKMIRAREGM
jgi:hypothetical protein